MQHSKQHNFETESELMQLINEQRKSLFIGTIVNELPLYNYIRTKELVNNQEGYSKNILEKAQCNIDDVKRLYPNIYDLFRYELALKMQIRRKTSMFEICDFYLRLFIEMNTMEQQNALNGLVKFQGYRVD